MMYSDRSRSLLAHSVDEALLRVERQRARIAELVQIGQPTKAAENLLSIFLRLFADLVELEHKINAMVQHATASFVNARTTHILPSPDCYAAATSAGARYVPPWANSAQAMRAILLASATATTLKGRR